AAPRRHAEAAFLPAVRDRLEHTFGIEIAAGGHDAPSAVLSLTMGTLLLQKKFMTPRNHVWGLEVRNVSFGIGRAAHENRGDHHRPQSIHHETDPTLKRERGGRAWPPSCLHLTDFTCCHSGMVPPGPRDARTR